MKKTTFCPKFFASQIIHRGPQIMLLRAACVPTDYQAYYYYYYYYYYYTTRVV